MERSKTMNEISRRVNTAIVKSDGGGLPSVVAGAAVGAGTGALGVLFISSLLPMGPFFWAFLLVVLGGGYFLFGGRD
jgi:hypothetical protein